MQVRVLEQGEQRAGVDLLGVVVAGVVDTVTAGDEWERLRMCADRSVGVVDARGRLTVYDSTV